MQNLLENNLIRFVHLLRRMGLNVGTGEVIDAFNAIELISPADKEAFKAALSSTLVKSKNERAIFNHSFNLFFSLPQVRKNLKKEWQKKKQLEQDGMERAETELCFQGESLNLSAEQKKVYSYLSAEQKQRVQNYIKKAEQGEKDQHNHKSLLETIVKSALSYYHRQVEDEFIHTLNTDDEELDSIAGAIESSRGAGQFSVMYEDMQKITESGLPQAKEVIRLMTRSLVKTISRRYHKSKRKRRLDLRRVIRGSIGCGGTFFKLKFKEKRVSKPRLLLLCDVSGSMVRYSEFVIEFIYGINSVLGRIETFIFADNLEQISHCFQSGLDFNVIMTDIINISQEWGGGTSLAQSLQTLRENYGDTYNSKTIALIVSDTCTTNLPQAEAEMKKFSRCVRDIIWLNPMPREKWEKAISVEVFLRYVRMFSCNTLADLERVVRKGLRL